VTFVFVGRCEEKMMMLSWEVVNEINTMSNAYERYFVSSLLKKP